MSTKNGERRGARGRKKKKEKKEMPFQANPRLDDAKRGKKSESGKKGKKGAETTPIKGPGERVNRRRGKKERSEFLFSVDYPSTAEKERYRGKGG